MKWYPVKVPWIFRYLFPRGLFRIPRKGKSLFLTFDDGPHPEITPWVLTELKKYDAKATFFLIGDNMDKYPDVVSKIIEEGHTIGNHTQNHPNGWTTSSKEYKNQIQIVDKKMESRLFRPPYGKITPLQYFQLIKDHKLVMWDVLSGDFDIRKSPNDCIQAVKQHSKPGSIIVFHDSDKAWPNLKVTLPEVLSYFSQLNYSFQPIR